jgi:hypothetical protein
VSNRLATAGKSQSQPRTLPHLRGVKPSRYWLDIFFALAEPGKPGVKPGGRLEKGQIFGCELLAFAKTTPSHVLPPMRCILSESLRCHPTLIALKVFWL